MLICPIGAYRPQADTPLLMVRAALCGTDTTLTRLRQGGLDTAVAARASLSVGPVLHRRADGLTARRITHTGQQHEELVVIRGDRSRQ